MNEPEPYRPRCVYLTCKSMQVYGEDFAQDPEFQAGMVEFSCTRTFRGWGPDGAAAAFDACSNPDRACFSEFVELASDKAP